MPFKRSFLMIVLLLLIISGCQMPGAFKDISANQAKEMIDNSEALVLDVRTAEEFAEGHIPGAQLIPVQILEEELSSLSKDETYVVVCRSGNRSVTASEILVDNGFKNILNLEDGMNGWDYEIDLE